MEEKNQEMLRRLAREARREPTRAEKALWERLRDHHCGGLHFRRQDIIGPFRLDFFCRSVKLAIEVDGTIHSEKEVGRRDADRQQILEQEFGIRFLRISNEDVLRSPEKVIAQILSYASTLTEPSAELS